MQTEDKKRIISLIGKMKRLDIDLWLDNDKLRFRDNHGNLNSELKDELKSEKINIIEYFKELEKVEKLPLTPLQYAYLMGEDKDYELGGCSAHYYLEYETKSVDVKRLEDVLNRSIAENDALRMRIMSEGWQYVQEETGWVNIAEYVGDDEWKRLRNERSSFMYRPEQWPMLNFAVTHLDEKDIIHIDFDCMILDAASARMMIQNILRDYNGEDVVYPVFGFADYLKKTAGKDNEKAEKYWSERSKTMPPAPKLPYIKPFSDVENISFKRFEHFFTREETDSLYSFAKKNHFSLASVICTCFAKTLYKETGNTPLTLDITLFSRQMADKESDHILGEFTNVGFVSMTDEKESFVKQVMDIQMQFWKLLQYRDYDGTKILKMLNKGKYNSAVMPVVFTCVLGEQGENEEIDGFKEIYSLSRTPQVSLDHHVRENNGQLKISWDYVEELFDKDELQSIFEKYIGQIRKTASENLST